ncbi:uncharacterized protein LOC132631170 [Lycium barbarum]|uniref:uncharacterized protein LOC132631170 n=1 Tax=Lycium barbarum TaxID=112863 RepID=UPI00293EB0E4|nr:uncharacterized protein LOC132631170 [Lycium barbarum]
MNARELPVAKLLDFMRELVERWNATHNEEAKNTFTDLTKKYQEIINKNEVRASTEFLHTVIDGVRRFTVCLRARACTCGRFQLDEIPCGHAMTAIVYRHQHGAEYTSAYYNNKNFLDTYAIPVVPLPCERTWDIPRHVKEEIVLPPDGKRPPGRPATKRMKPFHEGKFKKSTVTCSRCGTEGHNKKTLTVETEYNFNNNNNVEKLMYCGKYVKLTLPVVCWWTHWLSLVSNKHQSEPEARAATRFKTPLKPNCMKDVSNMINKLKDS